MATSFHTEFGYVYHKRRIMQGFRLSLFQCGWRDEMQAIATDIMKSSGGLSVKTMEELILEVIEEGKPLVPEDIKASVIRRIKENISSKNI
jgi:hypothetical protein